MVVAVVVAVVVVPWVVVGVVVGATTYLRVFPRKDLEPISKVSRKGG